jgi:hypothetical protein
LVNLANSSNHSITNEAFRFVASMLAKSQRRVEVHQDQITKEPRGQEGTLEKFFNSKILPSFIQARDTWSKIAKEVLEQAGGSAKEFLDSFRTTFGIDINELVSDDF